MGYKKGVWIFTHIVIGSFYVRQESLINSIMVLATKISSLTKTGVLD